MNDSHKSKWLWVCAFMLACAGAWLSGELVKRHDDIWRAAESRQDFLTNICHAFEQSGVQCGHALKSRWAEVSLPIPLPTRDFTISLHRIIVPVAFLGLAYFVSMSVWFMLIGVPQQDSTPWHRLPLYLAYAGALVSLAFLVLMALGQAPWCVLCYLVHALNLLLLAAIRSLYRRRVQASRTTPINSWQRARRHAPVPSWVEARAIVVALLAIASLWLYRRANLVLKNETEAILPYKRLVASLREDPEFLLREHLSLPQCEIPTRATERQLPEQPRLVVFTDFECPSCYCNMRRIRNEIVPAFKGRLTVMIRHYPLCRDCNPNVKGKKHAAACDAAFVAEAARQLGGEAAFQKMHDLLFENRFRLGRPLYRNLARQVGLAPNQLMDEMNGPSVREAVTQDIMLAKRLKVPGTPTMFLNGRRITPICECPTFWSAMANSGAGTVKAPGAQIAASPSIDSRED